MTVNYLLFGACMSALGYAAVREDSLIVESGEYIGSDYTSCFRDSGDAYAPLTDEGKKLLYLLQEFRAADDKGRIDTHAMHPVLCRYLCGKNTEVLLDAHLVSISRENGLWHAVIYTNSGLRNIWAKNVLDTTVQHVTEGPRAEVSEKALNVFVSNAALGQLEALASDECTIDIKPGFYDNEYTVSFRFGAGVTICHARQIIEKVWSQTFTNGEVLIDAIAPEFETVIFPTDDAVCQWLSPYSFESPMEAFEAGVALAENTPAYGNGNADEPVIQSAPATCEGEKCDYYELTDGVGHKSRVNTPDFDDNYDLIVAGVGSAGTFCALSSAQEGLRVLGVERSSCVGGMSTGGVINEYHSGLDGGSYEAADIAAGQLLDRIYKPLAMHPDSKKIRFEQMLLKEGVALSFNTVVIGVYAVEKEVIGVRILSGGKIKNIRCGMLCDSTSEGHVLNMLGVPYVCGRPSDGITQPFTCQSIVREKNGRLVRTNYDSGYIDPYDDRSFSKEIIWGQAAHVGTYEDINDRLIYTAPQVGIREGRCFKGEQTLSLCDILENRACDDTLCIACSDVDRHGEDHAFDDKDYQDWFVICNLSLIAFKISISLGALVPQGWKRLFTAGRSISLEGHAAAAVRMNRDMYRIGECAGIAAALTLKAGENSLMKANREVLRRKSIERGCFDSERYIKTPVSTGGRGYRPVRWMTDPKEISTGLKSDYPGIAMWSCRRLNTDEIRAMLFDGCSDEDQDYARVCAVTLGMLGDRRAVPGLRKIVRDRETNACYMCRRYLQPWAASAICLLGRLGDTQFVPELLELLSPKEYEREFYSKEENVVCLENAKLNIIKYAMLSFALKAIIEMTEAGILPEGEIKTAVRTAVGDCEHIHSIAAGVENSTFNRIVCRLEDALQRFMGA